MRNKKVTINLFYLNYIFNFFIETEYKKYYRNNPQILPRSINKKPKVRATPIDKTI